MIVNIYHHQRPSFFLTGNDEDKIDQVKVDIEDRLYSRVASVSVDTLENAFVITQNTDAGKWTSNPGVRNTYGTFFRSTSAGDLFELNGHLWLVDNFGLIDAGLSPF